MSYKIGIDGGGTKTEYALFSDSSKPLFNLIGCKSNHEVLDDGIPEAAKILHQGISKLLSIANLTLQDIEKVSMGLAGMDHPSQIKEMKQQLLKYKIHSPIICNDGFLIIKAGSPTGYGIGYNAGTGTCCNAIDDKGNMLQLGGFSEFSGDVGNANWNATRTFRAVYDDVVLHIEKSMLTEEYYKTFALSNTEEFVASVEYLQTDHENNNIPILNQILFDCIQKGDAAALRILTEITDRASDFIACLALKMTELKEPIPVILSGSVHQKQNCSYYMDMLKEKSVLKCGKQLSFHILDCPPVTGAYYL